MCMFTKSCDLQASCVWAVTVSFFFKTVFTVAARDWNENATGFGYCWCFITRFATSWCYVHVHIIMWSTSFLCVIYKLLLQDSFHHCSLWLKWNCHRFPLLLTFYRQVRNQLVESSKLHKDVKTSPELSVFYKICKLKKWVSLFDFHVVSLHVPWWLKSFMCLLLMRLISVNERTVHDHYSVHLLCWIA